MPYKRSGKSVMHFKGGKWSVKQICKSEAAADAAINLLRGVEHGWHPTGESARGKMRRKRGK